MPAWKYLAISSRRRHDVAHVGVLRLPQRRWYADIDGIQIRHDAEIRGRLQFAFLYTTHLAGRHVLNVGDALVERFHLRFLQIDAGDGVALLAYSTASGSPT